MKKRRAAIVAVRVTAKDKAAFLHYARAQGLGLSSWIRMQLIAALRGEELRLGYMITRKAIEDKEYAREKRRRR